MELGETRIRILCGFVSENVYEIHHNNSFNMDMGNKDGKICYETPLF